MGLKCLRLISSNQTDAYTSAIYYRIDVEIHKVVTGHDDFCFVSDIIIFFFNFKSFKDLLKFHKQALSLVSLDSSCFLLEVGRKPSENYDTIVRYIYSQCTFLTKINKGIKSLSNATCITTNHRNLQPLYIKPYIP